MGRDHAAGDRVHPGLPHRHRALGLQAAFGLVLVCTLALSWALVLVAMLAANPEKVQIFGFVVLFPITFTSDAFVHR